jgi:hypothetical protein
VTSLIDIIHVRAYVLCTVHDALFNFLRMIYVARKLDEFRISQRFNLFSTAQDNIYFRFLKPHNYSYFEVAKPTTYIMPMLILVICRDNLTFKSYHN